VGLEPLEDRLDLVLFQLELGDDFVELRHVDAAVLLPMFEENGEGVWCHRELLSGNLRLITPCR